MQFIECHQGCASTTLDSQNIRTCLSNLSILESTTLEFSKEVCRSMVAMLDFDKSGKLGLDELKCLFNEITIWRVRFTIFSSIFLYNLKTKFFSGCIQTV